MAEGLLGDASLGYGLGLAADYKDKSNLALQLEKMRQDQEKTDELKKARQEAEDEKKLADFQKNIGLSKTVHRYLQPSYNEVSNKYIEQAYKLYQDNPSLAKKMLPKLQADYLNEISPLNTSNDRLLAVEKLISDKAKSGKSLNPDEQQMLHEISTNTLKDREIANVPFQTDLGELKIDPKNRTFDYNPIGEDTTPYKDLGSSAYATRLIAIPGSNKVQKELYIPATISEKVAYAQQNGLNPNEITSLEEMNAQRLANPEQERVDIKNNYAAVSNLAKNLGVTINDLRTNPNYRPRLNEILNSSFENNVRVHYPKSKEQEVWDSTKWLQDIAQNLKKDNTSVIGKEFIHNQGKVSDSAIDNAWNGVKNTPLGKAAITQYGGDEKAAKEVFKNSVKGNTESNQQLRPDVTFGGGGFTDPKTNIFYSADQPKEVYPEAYRDELHRKWSIESNAHKIPANMDFETYFRKVNEDLKQKGINKAVSGFVPIKPLDTKKNDALNVEQNYIFSHEPGKADRVVKGKIVNILVDPNSKDNNKDAILEIQVTGKDGGNRVTYVPAKYNSNKIISATKGADINEIFRKVQEAGANSVISSESAGETGTEYENPNAQKKGNGGEVIDRYFILGNKAYKESVLKGQGYNIDELQEYKINK